MFSQWWDTLYDVHNVSRLLTLSLVTVYLTKPITANICLWAKANPHFPYPMRVLLTLILISHHISSHHQASFAKELLDHMQERGHSGEVRCPHCRQQGGFRAAEVEAHYEGCVRHVNKFKCGHCDSRFRCVDR